MEAVPRASVRLFYVPQLWQACPVHDDRTAGGHALEVMCSDVSAALAFHSTRSASWFAEQQTLSSTVIH